MIVVAPFSAKIVEHLGTKRVVVGGMLVFATGLIVASTITVSTGYSRLGVAMLLLGGYVALFDFILMNVVHHFTKLH